MQRAYVLRYSKIDPFFELFKNSNFEESTPGILGEFWYVIHNAPGWLFWKIQLVRNACSWTICFTL